MSGERTGSILFVNNFPGRGIGGGEVQTLALVAACHAHGMRVTVAAQPGGGFAIAAAEHGAVVIPVDFVPSRLPYVIREVRHAVVSSGARIVQGTGFFTNIIARLSATDPAVQIVNAVHVEPGASRLDGGSRAGLALRAASELATRTRVDRFVAVSDAVAGGLVARYGIPTDNIVVIPNGVDVDALAAEAREGAIGVELPAGDGPLVGCIARLETVKGVEHFVRMAARVAAVRPGIRFVLAGSGSLESQLRTIMVAERLGERFTFAGHVAQVAPLIAALDILVVPSVSEGFGIVALEAMALRTPVVASRTGGLPDVVVDGVTGLLAEPGDVAALASAVLELLDDPGRRTLMGEAGNHRALERFTLDGMTSAYLDLYTELLDD